MVAFPLAGDAAGAVAKPHPDWMPLHRAQFHFLPAFVPTDKVWDIAMERLLRHAARDHKAMTIGCEGGIARAVLGRLALVIDRHHATFALLRDDWYPEPYGYPSQFFHEGQALELEPDADCLIRVAESVWEVMRRMFDEALSSGKAGVWARPQALAPFVKLFADQWRLFRPKLTRSETGGAFERAIGPEREIIYSPHISAVCSRVDVPSKTVRKQNLVLELIEIIRASPMKRTMTIEQIIPWARERFGKDLTDSEILACRKKAINVAKPNTWGKGARPRKS